MTSRNEILAALAKVVDPELRRPITELGMVGENTETSVDIKLTIPTCPAAKKIEAEANAAVASLGITVNLTSMNQDERDALKEKLRAGRAPRTNPFDENSLTRVFLVGSGKGGVGKSSITANLAVALAAKGFSVGLIDADIFGYSIPGQLGISDKPTQLDEMILPPVAFGVKVISIGMFVDRSQAVAWRGPMLHRTVEQFLKDVYWGQLDFLLIDMPPGTGDVAISLGQNLPTAKSLVVTTPQTAAAEVALRSGALGVQTGQSVFGVIENMSWLENSDGSRLEIFGAGGGEAVAKHLDSNLLGQVPISIELREGSDSGKPVVLASPETAGAKAIIGIADQLAQVKLDLKGKRLPLL
ncbi:MAG: Mrp/NBP35 family ATP-binding protein [Micrococcales bacterium]